MLCHGCVDSYVSQGTNQLIRDGANLITSLNDLNNQIII